MASDKNRSFKKHRFLKELHRRISTGHSIGPSEFVDRGADEVRWAEDFLLSARQPMENPSRSVPGYRLLQLIGASEAGWVYTGVADSAHKKLVAVKVFDPAPPEFDAPHLDAERARFKTDYPRAAIRILDCVRTDDQFAVAMELVYGQPIDHFCQQRELGLQQRIVVLQRMIDSMKSLHDRDFFHGALSTAKILVGVQGESYQIKVAGFGMPRAKNLETVAERKMADLADLLKVSQAVLLPINLETTFDHQNVQNALPSSIDELKRWLAMMV